MLGWHRFFFSQRQAPTPRRVPTPPLCTYRALTLETLPGLSLSVPCFPSSFLPLLSDFSFQSFTPSPTACRSRLFLFLAICVFPGFQKRGTPESVPPSHDLTTIAKVHSEEWFIFSVSFSFSRAVYRNFHVAAHIPPRSLPSSFLHAYSFFGRTRGDRQPVSCLIAVVADHY